MTMLFFTQPALALNSITVMADGNITVAIAEIARNYSRDKNIIVNTSFAAASLQERQIIDGSAADVLITPDAVWIEDLKMQGLVDIGSRTPVAKDRLALVGPPNSPPVSLTKGFPTSQIIGQLRGEPGFALGNPETLREGVYGKEALRKLKAANDLEPYTVYFKRREDMFDLVSHYGGYGIFFYSTAIRRPEVRALDLLPNESYPPIQYFAVAIAGDNMEMARKFIDYLNSEQAKLTLRENGFLAD